MRGLELAERYYEDHGRPMIAEHFAGYEDRIAVGLAGEGSECFGFDDELSRDHDWGPGFCLWLTAEDEGNIGADLQARYEALPRRYAGFDRGIEGPHAGKRTGVFAIKDFYRRFIRYDHVPVNLAEWRSLPETSLATATNGRIFTDPLGDFTVFREGLLAFYPKDVLLKKLAARCATAGQAGQYNYKRCVIRGELVAAHCALAGFIEAAVSIVYLLNKRYRPFYKWMHRGMKELPILGEPCHELLADLCAEGHHQTGLAAFAGREEIVERISALIIAHLTVERLSESESDFLLDHAHAVQVNIQDQALRNLHVMLE